MMRMSVKIFVVITLLICFFACGKKSETVSLEKDGQIYEIADSASFYYPKEFSLDATLQNKKIIQFVKEQEVISYTMVQDDTDNKLEELPELYAGQLEEDGATDVGYKNITIESGLTCQEFTGAYKATGLKFKHMVYFTTDASYIFGYQAPQEKYDKNIAMISQYLSTLTVNHK